MSKFLAEIRDGCDGGAEEDRTPDLCSAIEVDGIVNGDNPPIHSATAMEQGANMERTSTTCTGATPESRALAEIAAFATEAVAVRDAGFTIEALRYPRTERELALICAFNGCPLDLAPRGWRYFPNAGTQKAWQRVAAVSQDQAA